MAKVYSHSESRAKGSVGMTTYRYVRGKVVQSQKIAPWDPAVEQKGNATRWNERTALLGLISLWCSAHAQSIINSFNRTKGGSQRNYFMKKNYAALRMALADLAIEYASTKVAPELVAIEDAIGAYAALHPNTIYRVKKSGYDIVFLSNNWDDADDPTAPALIDMMQATLDYDYQLTKVVMVGSNLSQAIKMRLAGANLDGNLVISLGGARAEFTPAVPQVVIGEKMLDAMIGSVVKKSIVVVGDQRDYYNLSLLVSPNNGGIVTGAGRYVVGSSIPVSATPNAGYRFLRWSDGDTNANRNIEIVNDITLTAEFTAINVDVMFNVTPGEIASVRVGNSVKELNELDEYKEFKIEKGSNVTIEVTAANGRVFSSAEFASSVVNGTYFGNDPEDEQQSTSENPFILTISANQERYFEINLTTEAQ